MATKLLPLKKSPMSSAWNFRGEVNGILYWSSRNGKMYAKDSQGNWYKVVSTKER